MRARLTIPGLIVCGLAAAAWFYQTPIRLVRWASASSHEAPAEEDPAVQVSVAAAQRHDVPIYLSGIGTVKAYNTVEVRTQVDGQITGILFDEGQEVRAGDRLVLIDPRPYQARVDQYSAARMRDQALLEAAKLNLGRYSELVVKGFSTQQQVDDQKARVGQLEANIADDTARMEQAQVDLGFTTITSPITGRIGLRGVDLGNYVRASGRDKIATIAQFQPISVVLTIPADGLAATQLVPGRSSQAVSAMSEDQTTELDRGTLEAVDNEVDKATGTIKLKASFPNQSFKLWPGNYVYGRVVVDTRRGAITIPSEAIRHGARCDFVWVVNPANVAHTRCITPGQVSGGQTLIERGLAANARVVVDGYYRLQEGAKVTTGDPSQGQASSSD